MRSTTLAAPLLLELQRAILERDAWPLLRVELPGRDRGVLRARARPAARRRTATWRSRRPAHATRASAIQAPDDVRALAGVDPERVARCARARRDVRERRDASAGARRCGRRRPRPQQAGMPLEDFGASCASAMFLDRPDPVARLGRAAALPGRAHRTAGRRTRDPHRGRGHGPDPRGAQSRTWVNRDGKRNMPSGEVFTGPLERSANGRIRFTSRRARRASTSRGVELEFARRRGRRGAPPSGATSTCSAALATDDGARRARRAGHRHELRHRPRRSARSSSTRRSAARSTSRSVARIRRRAAGTTPRCTGTSSATCAGAGGSRPTAS